MSRLTILPDVTGPLPAVLRIGRNHLAMALGAAGYNRGVEVGTWEGGYAEKLCQANPQLKLTCVDPWTVQEGYQEAKNDPDRLSQAHATAKRRLAPFGCELLQMTSVEAAPLVPDGSVDFVYLDANHRFEFVLEDIRLWLPKVRSGGVFAGHDYMENPKKPFIQVKGVIDAYTRECGIDPWFVLAADKSPSWLWVVN